MVLEVVKKLQPLTWARADRCSVIWIFWELPDFFRCLNVCENYSCILTYSGQLAAVIDHKAIFFCPFWSDHILHSVSHVSEYLPPSLLSFVENNKQKPQKQISKSTFGYSLLQKKNTSALRYGLIEISNVNIQRKLWKQLEKYRKYSIRHNVSEEENQKQICK